MRWKRAGARQVGEKVCRLESELFECLDQLGTAASHTNENDLNKRNASGEVA